MDAENLTAFLKTEGDNQPIEESDNPSVPFLRVTLVMLRIQFIKRNNGVSEVTLTTRDLEGSLFRKNLTEPALSFNELPFLGNMT